MESGRAPYCCVGGVSFNAIALIPFSPSDRFALSRSLALAYGPSRTRCHCLPLTVTGCGGSLAGDTYTTGAITGDCTVSATFSNLELIFGNGFEAP